MLDILLALFMALVIICIWIMLFDSNRFVVRTVSVSDERIKKPYRVVVISDLHNKRYGRDNAYLLSAIDAKEPDAIFIAGDILTAHPKEKLDVAISFVEELAKKYPIYYGNGNHESRLHLRTGVYGDKYERFTQPLLSYPSDKPKEKIDYIFVSSDFMVISADIPEIVASDHRPHIAEIEV